jgi:uncharacterized protein (TIGR02444 family)
MSAAKSGDSPFWTFSLGYYGGAGVSEACIELQDRCGADVNVILFLAWLASQRRRIAGADIAAIAAKALPWQNEVIAPIRALRRHLKNGAPLVDAATGEAFRNKIKALELESEQLQQAAMTELAKGLATESAASAREAARANIDAYAGVLGRPLTTSAVDTLVAALG